MSSRTISRLRSSAPSVLRHHFGCTKSRSGNGVDSTSRTVSSCCTARTRPVSKLRSSTSLGEAGSETSYVVSRVVLLRSHWSPPDVTTATVSPASRSSGGAAADGRSMSAQLDRLPSGDVVDLEVTVAGAHQDLAVGLHHVRLVDAGLLDVGAGGAVALLGDRGAAAGRGLDPTGPEPAAASDCIITSPSA